ncbi:MAG: winged helix-turn-helix transcriptional regulator [Methanocorpusculum sp.]|nr:winged helix-turn-helix transcriptional regulator [Methanocorpusculum sp.]
MSSTQTAVLLLLLCSIFTAVLLFVPAEITVQQKTAPVANPAVIPAPVPVLENATVMRVIMMWDDKRDYRGSILASYGAAPLEVWEWAGKGSDEKTAQDWLHGVMNEEGEFWKNIETYYGSIEDGPVNLIEFGGAKITIHVGDNTTREEIDRIYTWWNASMADAGIPALPTEFRYGGSVYLTGTTTDSATIIIIGELQTEPYFPPQKHPNYLRSILLLLCTGGVAAIGFSRMLELSQDPASRPQRIAVFIAEHPGCSQKEIADATGFSRGSILYQLKRLERKKIVRHAAYFRSIRYFPVNDDGSVMERILRTVLTRERPAQILRGIAETPGIGKEELAKKIGIAKTTLAWHLRRFAKSGILIKNGEGWALTPEAAEVWERL